MHSSTPRRYGHRGGGFRQQYPRPNPVVLPDPETTQARIETLTSIPTLSSNYSAKAQIEHVEYVASFNWADARDPTILVPGAPPRWQPHVASQKLHEDAGTYYRDTNSARFPSFPTEPAIRAICEQVPEFELSEVDVFGCGNTLGSLLSFAGDEERTFRFGVDYVGASLFLVRKTNKPAELIEDVRGYGHTFPESYTQWDRSIRHSASHQRIIKYNFAGLKCFVRSESDGYIPDLVDAKTKTPAEANEISGNSSDDNKLLALALGLQTLSGSNKLVLQRAGRVIPQGAVFDLKTRSIRSKQQGMSVEGFLHRLWVNQTPNMILAYHTSGTFNPTDIHIVDVRSKVVGWEAANTTLLSKLGGLLHWLIELAKRDGRSRFEIRRIGVGPLEIWSEVPGWSALSPDFTQQLGASTSQEDAANDHRATHSDTESSEDDNADYLKF